MQSGIDHAAIADLPLVVGVAEQLVENGHCQWPAWPLGGGPSTQATGRQLIQQPAQRDVAFGVAVEGPGHQVRSTDIDLHGAIDAPEFVGDMDVLISKRRS